MARVEEVIIEGLKIKNKVIPLEEIGLCYTRNYEWHFVAAQKENKIILPTSERAYFVSFFKDSLMEATLLYVAEFDNLKEFYDEWLDSSWDITIDC